MHLFEGCQLSAVSSCLVLSLLFHLPFSLFLCLLTLSLGLRVMLYVCVVCVVRIIEGNGVSGQARS